MTQQISFNGKTYNSVDEMPAADRAMYEQVMQIFGDKDGNGIPDVFEGKLSPEIINQTANFTTSGMSIVYEGQTYNSFEELPPEGQKLYQERMGKLQQLGNVLGGATITTANFGMKENEPYSSGGPQVVEVGNKGPLSVFMLVLIGLMGFIGLAILFSFLGF